MASPPLSVKLMLSPAHIGELLFTVTTGTPFIITSVVETPVQPFPSVIVTEYVPEFEEVALAIFGFWSVDEKLFGPDQLHETASPALSVKFNVPSNTIGELLPAVAVGVALTVTTIVEIAVHPFPSVIVTEYVPEFEEVALAIFGDYAFFDSDAYISYHLTDYYKS